MRILHLLSQRPDATGSGIYLQALVKFSNRAGHRNFVIAGLPDQQTLDLPDLGVLNTRYMRFESAEYPGRIIGMSDVMPYPTQRFRDLNQAQLEDYLAFLQTALEKGVQDFAPDLIHSHHLWLLSSLARRLFPEIPMVASCHGSELRQFSQCPHLRDYVSNGCRQLCRICSLSEAQQAEIASLYQVDPARIEVIGSGYHDSLFFPDATRARRSTTELLFAGKLSRAKGVPWLLDAIREINDPTVHVHLAGGGSGTEYQDCLDRISQIRSPVTLHGRLSQADLASLMRRMDIFVLPSLHEGVPLVLLEALASGCCVIATDLPGTRVIEQVVQSAKLIVFDSPKVIDTDLSLLADESTFVSHLRTALLQTIARLDHLQSEPAPDLHQFTWETVYAKVEACWHACLGT